MFFQWIPCHRNLERSIKVGSFVFPLCARCMAILIGYLFLPLLFKYSFILSWWEVPLLVLPLLIDGFTQKWKWRKSNNFLRIITGFLFGIAQCIIIVLSVLNLIKLIT